MATQLFFLMQSSNHDITYIGITNFRNKNVKFGIKRDDRRRHFYIIGKTGMGKTNLMENMAIQDIWNGNGLAFVDPHGEAATRLLDFIPEERVKDVIYLDPSDSNFPIGFNILERASASQRPLIASGIMGVFKKIWPDVWSARMEYILNNTILALLEHDNQTMLGINRMLADKEYRKMIVNGLTDPIVKSFWTQEFAKYQTSFQVEAIAPIQNKAGQFVGSPLIRNIVGQTKSTFNIREAMDTGKILILNLSRGRIGEENSRLLGALLIIKLQLSAMSRVDIPNEEDRRDFYLYVDEFQHFATESFASILSEARKYRLGLIMGHQYISQMDELTRDAVFGNVGTISTFRVGAEDAEVLEKEFAPEFTANDIVNLTKYHAYLKLMIDGIASPAFSYASLAPLPKLERAYRDEVIDYSRKSYSMPREVIEGQIARWAEALERATLPRPEGGDAALPPGATPGSLPAAAQAESTLTLQADNEVVQVGDNLFLSICAQCGKKAYTTFQPDGKRPVYCKTCLDKMRKERNKKIAHPAPAASPDTLAEPLSHEPQFAAPISLDEAVRREPTSFTPKAGQAPQRRTVDVEGLKGILEESMRKKEQG